MRFDDLEVWKRSVQLSMDISRRLMELKDYAFRDQITRAGLSLPSNTAEGFERERLRERLAFSSYAKGSCGERNIINVGWSDQKQKEFYPRCFFLDPFFLVL